MRYLGSTTLNKGQNFACNNRKLTLLLHTISECSGPAASSNSTITHNHRITMEMLKC